MSSWVKGHQNTQNSFKCEVIWKCQITLSNMKYYIKQYLRSILDTSPLNEMLVHRKSPPPPPPSAPNSPVPLKKLLPKNTTQCTRVQGSNQGLSILRRAHFPWGYLLLYDKRHLFEDANDIFFPLTGFQENHQVNMDSRVRQSTTAPNNRGPLWWRHFQASAY